MKRDLISLPLDLGNELIIDNFAGGGGTSTGLEAAFGRPVDIAINHDPEALAMHAINHPYTRHLCESVWDVDPIKVTGNQPVGLVWLSPDCKHFSKAKGGTPVSKHIRGLAWVGMRWIALTKPRVLMLENVEEFQTWGPVIAGPDGNVYPDPKRRGKTFESFVRQLRHHGYKVGWKELRACDNGAPTIRKRLFLVARRDGLPIVFPDPTHGEPLCREVLAGILAPYRTAAECIDFGLPAESIFDRKKSLVTNTQRRVAKGLWRYVLTSATPFIVGVGGRMGQSPERTINVPVQTITAKADSCIAQPVLVPFMAGTGGPTYSGEPAGANQPIGTLTTENHRAIVGSTLVPLRGTTEAHLGGRSIEQPATTISAGGTHHALVGAELVAAHIQRDMGNSVGHPADDPLGTTTAGGGGKSALIGTHLITIGYGERPGQDARAQDVRGSLGTVVAANKHALVAAHLTKFRAGSSGSSMADPVPTVTANSFVKRPGGSVPMGFVGAHLMHLTHHGDRPGSTPADPLPTVTGAHRGEQALAAAFFEQANGGFYEGDGRPADVPLSTIMGSGSNQRMVTAYLVRYPEGVAPKLGQGQVSAVRVSADCLAPEHREKARKCAALLHEHLPEHFPEQAAMVLMAYDGAWWALVDITLRMLKAHELYRAQSFPDDYVIHEIPDPKLLFKDGVQVPGDPRLLPRIRLSITAQIRMCGNSVAPAQAEALVRANFMHEQQIAAA